MRDLRLIAFLLLSLLGSICYLIWRWSTGLPERLPNTISGEVCDEHGFVAAAKVRVQGTPETTLTDSYGQFHLPRQLAAGKRLTAWKQGYFIGSVEAGAPSPVIQLRALPDADCENYRWVDPDPDAGSPQNCGNCHEKIHSEWTASGHARAASNRQFLNLYDGSDWQGRQNIGWNLLAENPDGAGVCTACHAPALAFGDPAYYDLRQAAGTAAKGVHCDYCHKVADVEDVQFGRTHGRFGLRLLRPADGQITIGPLDDVDRGDDTFAAIYRDSRYCATCHEGTVFGVHVYGTYSEWLDSPARKEGKQCQSCHMTPTGTMSNFAPGKGGIERDPQSLANHRFFAGDRFTMLRKSLRVEVQSRLEKETTRVDIAILAQDAGHRVPTGFSDRNILLVVEALEAAGRSLPPREVTPLLPTLAGKSFRGQAGILYAKQLSDFDGHSPVPFWRARPELADTRLSPGQAERSAFDFAGSADRIRVRLLYRRFWQDIADIKGWPNNEAVILDKTIPFSASHNLKWTAP
jgi:hypothetical protein